MFAYLGSWHDFVGANDAVTWKHGQQDSQDYLASIKTYSWKLNLKSIC